MADPTTFNQEVREIIFERAQKVAEQLGHREIEPEDLLIATTRAASTAPLFRHLGVEPDDLARRLLAAAPRGPHKGAMNRQHSIESGRKTIRMWKQARRVGTPEVGAQEFLLALLDPPPKRFLFVFPRPTPPFWAALEAAGITEATILRAIHELRGAA